MTDTIFALASPPGRGGVAVIRVSGPASHTSLRQLSAAVQQIPRVVMLHTLLHPRTKQIIDRALVLLFAGPASFTGEDVIEYHVHGGPAVVDALLAALGTLSGFRLAEPGEFTRRAFENGKMDLTAAEAVADLIDAETEAQRMQALDQMGGALAQLYDGWREDLTRTLAYLEADIDFPDEDLPDGIAAHAKPKLEKLLQCINDHLNDNRRGERLRDGIRVAVIGAPNAGKSSLVNALAQREIAIVSAHAGTTRDVIEAHLNIGGYPVILADTAGLRPDQIGDQGQEGIESEGIRRALKQAQDADIRLLVFDACALPARDKHTAALHNESALIVFNKSDLLPLFLREGAGVRGHDAQLSPPETPRPNPLPEGEGILVSAQTGQGLPALTAALTEKIKTLIGIRAAPSLTRQRHREALEQARESLLRAMAGKDAELIAEDTRLAMRALGRITGRVDVEDLLDVIFRDFCIGK